VTKEIHFRLTRAQREAIRRIGRDGTYMVRGTSHSSRPKWVSVGEITKEIVAKLDGQLDPDWITEYLAHHDNVNHREEN